MKLRLFIALAIMFLYIIEYYQLEKLYNFQNRITILVTIPFFMGQTKKLI